MLKTRECKFFDSTLFSLSLHYTVKVNTLSIFPPMSSFQDHIIMATQLPPEHRMTENLRKPHIPLKNPFSILPFKLRFLISVSDDIAQFPYLPLISSQTYFSGPFVFCVVTL